MYQINMLYTLNLTLLNLTVYVKYISIKTMKLAYNSVPCSWASYTASLRFNFFIYKMGIILTYRVFGRYTELTCRYNILPRDWYIEDI